MCQNKELREVENGSQNSDIHPDIQNDLRHKQKGFYMDEALSKTKFGLFNYAIIFVSGIILYAVTMEVSGVVFIIPVSQCDLKTTTSDKGILGGATLLGIICSSHLWGFLADTRGRRAVIQPTLFVAFFFSVCSSFIQNFYIFVALRFLNGFFISGTSATIYAYLGEFHNNAQRGRVIMGSTIILGTACIFLPLSAWGVINQDWQFEVPYIGLTYKPWRMYVIFCGIPGFIGALALTFFPESPKFVLGQGKNAEAYQILQKMNRWNNGKKSQLELFEIKEEAESIENRQRIMENKMSRFPLLKSIWIQTAPLFKPPYLGSTLLLCVIQFGIVATSSGFFMFYAEILNKMSTFIENFDDTKMMMCDIINMRMDNMSAMEITTEIKDDICVTKLELTTLEQGVILEILFALCYVVIGLLINRISKSVMIFFILLVSGLGGIVCMVTDLPLLQVYSYTLLMCSGIALSIVNAATVELYPTALRAMIMCISLMFGRLGSVVGANTVAFLLDDHCDTAFYLSGTSVIAIGVLAFFIPNLHQNDAKSDKVQNEPRLSALSFQGSVQ